MQAEISQICQDHVFDSSSCPRGKEELDQLEAKHAKGYSKGIKDRIEYSGHKENSLGPVALKEAVHAHVKRILFGGSK